MHPKPIILTHPVCSLDISDAARGHDDHGARLGNSVNQEVRAQGFKVSSPRSEILGPGCRTGSRFTVMVQVVLLMVKEHWIRVDVIGPIVCWVHGLECYLHSWQCSAA